jgi:hypothetical protein
MRAVIFWVLVERAVVDAALRNYRSRNELMMASNLEWPQSLIVKASIRRPRKLSDVRAATLGRRGRIVAEWWRNSGLLSTE